MRHMDVYTYREAGMVWFKVEPVVRVRSGDPEEALWRALAAVKLVFERVKWLVRVVPWGFVGAVLRGGGRVSGPRLGGGPFLSGIRSACWEACPRTPRR